MYEIRRTSAARAVEEDMPESLSVAFGAYLDQIADDPWSAGDPWELDVAPEKSTRIGTFGFNGRGIVLYKVIAADPPYVLIAHLTY